MAKKNYLVIFMEYGARIEKDPVLIEKYKNNSNVLYNPELPHGVPIEFWVKNKNKIGIKLGCGYSEIKLEPAQKHKQRVKYLSIALVLVTIGLIYNVLH